MQCTSPLNDSLTNDSRFPQNLLDLRHLQRGRVLGCSDVFHLPIQQPVSKRRDLLPGTGDDDCDLRQGEDRR